jgi:C4-dicarboxylate-specific signal transduction histidine kinase
VTVTDQMSELADEMSELAASLRSTAERLRSGELEPPAALEAIEECAQLAARVARVSAAMDERARAAVEPLPDLPGQLPLPAQQ